MKTKRKTYAWTDKDVREVVQAILSTPLPVEVPVSDNLTRDYINSLTYVDRCDSCGSVELVPDIQLCWQCLDKFPKFRMYRRDDTPEF